MTDPEFNLRQFGSRVCILNHYDKPILPHRILFSLDSNDKMPQVCCCVSYLLLHKKWFKTISSYYFKVFVSQEFRSSWAECSYELAVKILMRLQSLEGLAGAKKSASKMAHSHDCW